MDMIGHSQPRIDALAKVTGKAEYARDFTLPGVLEALVLRSPWPHARILHLDTRRAAALPGVRAVLTAADLPDRIYGTTVQDMPVLARGLVRYQGEPVAAVAAVAAVDQDTAREALELIHVEYDKLPAVYEASEALKPGAPVLHPEYASYRGSKGVRQTSYRFGRA